MFSGTSDGNSISDSARDRDSQAELNRLQASEGHVDH
jgi:hypothetical protein